MIQRSKIDVILRTFWKTSFVTFLRDMSRKDWNPIFRINRLNISMRREAEFLLFCSLTEMNFPFFAGLNFFSRHFRRHAYLRDQSTNT